MIDCPALKVTLLAELHANLAPKVSQIRATSADHDSKAKAVNADVKVAVEQVEQRLLAQFSTVTDRQTALLVLQYCASVVSLEYRHKVWPYEYMAFSRRVGELWERFCKACWDHPSRQHVERISPPSFEQIKADIFHRIESNTVGATQRDQILDDVNLLLGLVGDINMKEDEVFTVDGIPHVIDFKSGFGSNEKGNTLRLLAVGRAYRLWNPDTALYLLVRQEDNNNYLNVIRRNGLWGVHCAAGAYAKIDELTGALTANMRESIIDFEGDLSAQFMSDIGGQLADLRAYLRW